MEGEDFEFKEFHIPEAVGLAFNGFDFVVGAFQEACRDGLIIIGQDADLMSGLSTFFQIKSTQKPDETF